MTISKISETNLFKPIKLNDEVTLKHRIAFAPSTRVRHVNGTPSDLMLEYYDARSKEPGSLLVTEGTVVSKKSAGFPCSTAYKDEDFAGWKVIVDKVHENKSFFSLQIAALGRSADVSFLNQFGEKYTAPSAVYISEEAKATAEKLGNPLTALTTDEVKLFVDDFVVAATRGVEESGFDFIEIHGANGFLINQFFDLASNKRTDAYGGSFENRARFFFEIVDATIAKIGASKTAVRLSPWGEYNGMSGTRSKTDTIAFYSYVADELQKRHRKHGGLGYLSIVEPRVDGANDVEHSIGTNDFFYEIYQGAIMTAGNWLGISRETLIEAANKDDRTLIAVSRYFTSNPDLVYRLKNDIALTPYDRPTFYTGDNWGYNTFPAAGEEAKEIVSEEEAKKQFPVALTVKD